MINWLKLNDENYVENKKKIDEVYHTWVYSN